MKNKNFGNRYDEVYREGLQKSVWPWSSVVTILHKLKKYLNPNAKILEIGCGMGANIELIQSLEYEYFGIDFSPYAINEILNLHPELSSALVAGDFTKNISFFGNKFDIILDRASLTCNPTSKIKNCIELIKKELITDGFFVGVDWYSTDHTGFKMGKSEEDEFSLIFDEKNSLFDPPRMHFSSKEHINDLFKEFEIIHFEHKLVKILKSKFSRPDCLASWNFVAQLK